MPDISILLAPLEGLLGFFQRERHHTDEEARHSEAHRQEALQAMYTALITTRKYTEAQPGQIDRDKQFELSGLWANVAIKCREYLQEEMPWTMEKSRYWLDEIKWPEERVKSAGIDLVTVEARIAELMRQ